MAIGWLTALKIVPWSEVIEAAPALVGSARKFLSRSQQPAPGIDAEALERRSTATAPDVRIEQLEAAVARLAEQQQASAALIETLAEQNARLVAAVDGLRKRLALSAVVLAGLAGGMAWLWLR